MRYASAPFGTTSKKVARHELDAIGDAALTEELLRRVEHARRIAEHRAQPSAASDDHSALASAFFFLSALSALSAAGASALSFFFV